jgi:hypothetical protein
MQLLCLTHLGTTPPPSWTGQHLQCDLHPVAAPVCVHAIVATSACRFFAYILQVASVLRMKYVINNPNLSASYENPAQ